MLIPNKIPDTEPEIRVGIILPEDRYDNITLILPQEFPCRLIDARNQHASISGITLSFVISGATISLNKFEQSAFWRIVPEAVPPLSSRMGIIIKNAVTGRGFHWQKQIDLYLPGRLELRILNGYLLVVNTLSLEQYIACVATSEMNARCPEAFLQAQTIAARSWLLANIEQKHENLGIDICNDDCCQRYQGSGNLNSQAIEASRETEGTVLMHQGMICDCRYSKSCGGITESFSNIWEGDGNSYLQSIIDTSEQNRTSITPLDSEEKVKQWIDGCPSCYCGPEYLRQDELIDYLGSVDENTRYYRWQFRQSHSEMVQSLNRNLNLGIKKIDTFKSLRRGHSGRIIELQVSYIDEAGSPWQYTIAGEYNIRKTLHSSFLYSSCIYIEKEALTDSFCIKGAGWGHGVGLCQIGALGMALKGISAADILRHYYPDTKLISIY